jgi:hypothetical protein
MQLIPASPPFGDPCGRQQQRRAAPSGVGGAAALVAAACGQGRPSLLCNRPLGMDCLASTRARARRRHMCISF